MSMKGQTKRPRVRIIFLRARQVLWIPPTHSFGSFVPATLYRLYTDVSLIFAFYFTGHRCSDSDRD